MDMLRNLEGKDNSEKRQYVKALEEKIEEADAELAKAVQDYIDGTITEEEYTKETLRLSAELKDQDVTSMIASQAQYVSEDTDNRYYMYQNGWIQLFAGTEVNYFVFFMLLLEVTSVFCNEYEMGMLEVNLVTSGGHRLQYIAKVAAGMCAAVVISLLFNIENVLITAWRFGLSGFSYPIQSIHIFSNCPWNKSIGEVFALYIMLGVVAAVFCTTLIFLFSVLFKKTIPTVLMVCSIVFIPLFLLDEKKLYCVPLPVSLLRRLGYVTGVYDVETGKHEFDSWNKLVAVLIGTTVVCLIVLFLAKKMYRLKKAVPFLLLSLLLLAGCGSQREETGAFFNDNGWGKAFWSEYGIIDATGNDMTITDSSGTKDLITDPFLHEEQENLEIVGVWGDCAYLVQREEESGDYDIIEINLSNQEQKRIYEHHAYLLDGTDYLDMQARRLQSYHASKQEPVYSCFAIGNRLYLLTDGSIYEVDLLTKRRSLIADHLGITRMSCGNGTIYYINEEKKLAGYDIADKEEKIIDDALVSRMQALDDRMLIQHMTGEIVSVDYETNQFTTICDGVGDMLHADQNTVYCSDDPTTVYVIDISTGEKRRTISTEREMCEIKSSADGETIYIVTVRDNEFYMETY